MSHVGGDTFKPHTPGEIEDGDKFVSPRPTGPPASKSVLNANSMNQLALNGNTLLALETDGDTFFAQLVETAQATSWTILHDLYQATSWSVFPVAVKTILQFIINTLQFTFGVTPIVDQPFVLSETETSFGLSQITASFEVEYVHHEDNFVLGQTETAFTVVDIIDNSTITL
jgi:hypothetical protein